MLNEERVRHMTHMAMMEKKNMKDYVPVTNISKSDFLSLSSILAFLLGTITYVGFYFVVIAVLFNTLLQNINALVLILLMLIGILGYLMYLFAFMTGARKRAKQQYRQGRKALNERVHDWDVLEGLYLQEEENRSPTIAMKDLEQLHQLDVSTKDQEMEQEELEPNHISESEPVVVTESVPESALEKLVREKRQRESEL